MNIAGSCIPSISAASGFLAIALFLSSPSIAQDASAESGSQSATTTPTAVGSASAASSSADVKVSLSTGGVRRYVANRWGVVNASVFNRSHQEASGLIVVTPKNSGGIQFARKVAVPSEMQFSTSWPVRVDSRGSSGQIDMEYLYFPSGEEDGEIRREEGESALPAISGMVSSGLNGISGVIPSRSPRTQGILPSFVRAMRFSKLSDIQLVTVVPAELDSQRECLDVLDHLAIGDPELLHYPHVCDAIRAWVCRGGRLLIAMDECGPEVAQYLLGGVLTVSVVGEVFPLKVKLDVNPEYPQNQYPVRSVVREFEEPVRYLRVVPDGGEPMWSVDGWPVAIRVPMGLGTVVVTTIQSDVFIEPRAMSSSRPEASHSVIASSRRMVDSLFNSRNPQLVSESAASAHAADLVGYQVPDRTTATLLLIVFPVLLVVAGVALQRKEIGQRLVWLLPVLAVAAAIPAIALGAKMRAVAPMTVVETSSISSTPGETQLAGDGFVSIYLPEPATLDVNSTGGLVMDVKADATNQDYKRLVWNDPVTSHWENLQQHVGLKTHSMRFEKNIPGAIQAVGTFDANGLVGTLRTEGLELASPLMLATENHLHSSLVQSGNEFRGSPTDVLANGQYFSSSFVSEESRFQSSLMAGVFDGRESTELYPSQPTVFFWVNPQNNSFTIGSDNVRRRQMALVAQPLQLNPPEADQLITIPAVLLPYRSVITDKGSLSSIFNNQTRRWTDTESAGTTRLRFDVPNVCRPFEVASAEVSVTMRAASRKVTFGWGDPSAGFKKLRTIASPLGTVTIPVPSELLANDRSGKLFVEFSVSEIGGDGAAGDSDVAMGEQDDSWKVERLMLTVTGRRKPVNVFAQ